MSVDELVRDALAHEVSIAPAATDAQWWTIEDRSQAVARTRRSRRLALGAVAVAAVLLAGVIIVRVGERSGSDNVFVGEPTTLPGAVVATGPPPVDGVKAGGDPVPGSTPIGWYTARTGIDDRQVILFFSQVDLGGYACGTAYAVVQEFTDDAVAVTVYPSTDSVLDSCEAPSRDVVLTVGLTEPLAGRRLEDGAGQGTGRYRAFTDGMTLLVPGGLPAGYLPQTESLFEAWTVCYAATAVLCSDRSIAGATVATIQAPSLGSLLQELEIPVGDKLASPPNGRSGIDWLLQHWIWPDPSTPPFVQVTVHGRPALVFDRSGAADRLGDMVVVWTEGTASDIDDTCVALGVSKQMGLTGDQLVALAESMHTVG